MAFLIKSEMIHTILNNPKIILNLTQNEWNVYEAHIPPHTRNEKVNFVIKFDSPKYYKDSEMTAYISERNRNSK